MEHETCKREQDEGERDEELQTLSGHRSILAVQAVLLLFALLPSIVDSLGAKVWC
jgi:hypothetical protein